MLEFPLFDGPFNYTDGYQFPSMDQSLHLTKNFYQSSHYAIAKVFSDKSRWQRFGAQVIFDFTSLWLPFGLSWHHEEWHRAVLSNRKISSYNEVYEFNMFSEIIAVSQVSDEDLVRLKREHPADHIRLSAAGLEAQYEFNLVVEKDYFFNNIRTNEGIILWNNYLNNIMYIHTCTTDEADTTTDDIEEDEGVSIKDRDFTGLDCTAWVYDLHRPNEPYEDRGIHPSGVGIRRYIRYSDLTDDEKDYLTLQRNLSLLNLVDPFLFRKYAFRGGNPFNGNPFLWNTTLRHHLTPFGYSVDINLFLKQSPVNLMTILHIYRNKEITIPGLDVEMLRYPVVIGDREVRFTTRLGLWLQPEDQMFMTDKFTFGSLFSLKVMVPVKKNLELYTKVEGKTDGWVAGNVYLENNVSFQAGVLLMAF